MAVVLDNLKQLGFRYATKSGTTIGMSDVKIPENKVKLIKDAEEKAATVKEQYNHGVITEGESYNGVIGVWMEATDLITESISKSLDRYGSIYMMSTSGAKGNISQIRQMAGMPSSPACVKGLVFWSTLSQLMAPVKDWLTPP